MSVPLWVWLVTTGLAVAVIVADLIIVARNPHKPSTKETGTALAVYIGAAILFGLGVWFFSGSKHAVEFYSGWLTEYSLSIDNLFVFLIIMAKLKVPEKHQQAALMAGITIALVLRAAFIAVGAYAIEQFAWVFYIFGAFLIFTAVKLMVDSHDDDDDDYTDTRLVRFVTTHLPFTSSWEHGERLSAREEGKRVFTPFFLVILALGTTDLMFALDSIPAIFGITQQPYLVLMTNIFALMGLRQLYFLMGGALKRLVYLGTGLSVLLTFIGVKLILHAMHENHLPFINAGRPISWAPEIHPLVSLGIIVGILVVTTVASLVASRRQGAGSREVEPF